VIILTRRFKSCANGRRTLPCSKYTFQSGNEIRHPIGPFDEIVHRTGKSSQITPSALVHHARAMTSECDDVRVAFCASVPSSAALSRSSSASVPVPARSRQPARPSSVATGRARVYLDRPTGLNRHARCHRAENPRDAVLRQSNFLQQPIQHRRIRTVAQRGPNRLLGK
jgi:hypothetical protein